MEPSFDVGTLFSQCEKNLNERDTSVFLASPTGKHLKKGETVNFMLHKLWQLFDCCHIFSKFGMQRL